VTGPDPGAARYLPRELAGELRGILHAVSDPDLRARLVTWGETCHQWGTAEAYERGYLDGIAELDARLREMNLLEPHHPPEQSWPELVNEPLAVGSGS